MIPRRPRPGSAAALAAALLLPLGCEDEPSRASVRGPGAAAAPAAGTAPVATRSGAAADPSSGSLAVAEHVTPVGARFVAGSQLLLELSVLPPGRTVFEVVNTTGDEHSFAVTRGGEAIADPAPVGPARTASVELPLGPGEYRAECAAEGHAARGERTPFVVLDADVVGAGRE